MPKKSKPVKSPAFKPLCDEHGGVFIGRREPAQCSAPGCKYRSAFVEAPAPAAQLDEDELTSEHFDLSNSRAAVKLLRAETPRPEPVDPIKMAVHALHEEQKARDRASREAPDERPRGFLTVRVPGLEHPVEFGDWPAALGDNLKAPDLTDLQQRVQHMLAAFKVIVERGCKPDRAVARLAMVWPPPDGDDVEAIERIAPREDVTKEDVIETYLVRVEEAQEEAIRHGLPPNDVMFALFCLAVQTYYDSGVPIERLQENVQKIYDERAKNKPEVH